MTDVLAVLSAELAAFLPVSDRVSVVFLEPDGEWMRIYRVLPTSEQTDDLPRVRVEGTPVGRVVREGVGRVVSDVRSDPNITFGHASHGGIRSTVSAPVRVGGRVVGVMNAGSRTPGACTAAMLEELQEIADAIGPVVFATEQMSAGRLGDPSQRGADQRSEDETRDASPSGLIGRSAPFRKLVRAAERAARADVDILLSGETGVGKTALARAIHRWSSRRQGPFVTVHLADLSPALVESELFGHERGAFTGAQDARAGRFESAHGGTLFLDEIGETPLELQAKLLRVIQERCFERVGGGRTRTVDVRLIAASCRDLYAATKRGEFREDLYYRLNVVPLCVPPLRDRDSDLEPLANAILRRESTPGRNLRLSARAWQRLRRHSWPGNIRELESVLRRAMVFEDGEVLELEDLECSREPRDAEPEWPTLDEHQRRYIERVLELCGGVIEGPSGAARVLDMRPSTLRSRMRRLGLSARPIRRARTQETERGAP